jgi:deazaflavin-dependent oxidoreductase (nitroreductase family)
MPKGHDTLAEHLSRSHEIQIQVIGRKSGRTISLPIWFVWDHGTVFLLPVKGSDTQWYKNVLKNPSVRIVVGGVRGRLDLIPITDAEQVKSVIARFRDKYGPGDVKKYYSNFDVAVFGHVG